MSPPKCYWPKKKKGVSQNGQTPRIIGICSYCVLDRPEFERCQTLLHLDLTPWWSFLLADGMPTTRNLTAPPTPHVVYEMAAVLYRPQCVNTLRPRQHGRHFADDTFKRIFLNENL